MTVKTYVVGGAVRDTLLGRTVKDVDYVVVGATPTVMINLGFKKVGSNFPVFLHRTTNEEYALARTESKVGNGYYGFTTDYNSSVTLREDLERRDLTVNALAVPLGDWDEFQKTKDRLLVVDYFNGLEDLEDGMLRHVSEAFADDPLRVLRVARFDARYDFNIDLETYRLMSRLVDDGELDHLTPERVYAEMEKAVMEDNPLIFFQVLDVVGAYDILFPELKSVDRLPLEIGYSLDRVVLLNGGLIDRLIVITAGLKPEAVQEMFYRLKAPSDVIKTLHMASKLIRDIFDIKFDEQGEDIFKLLNSVNAWKNVERFQIVMKVFANFDNPYLNRNVYTLLKSLKVANAANFSMLTVKQQAELEGVEISNAIADLRLNLIKKMIYV